MTAQHNAIDKAPPNSARFVVFQGADGMWYWKLTAGNGWTVAIGGEGFKTQRLAEGAVARAIRNASEAEAFPTVIDATRTKPAQDAKERQGAVPDEAAS